MSADNSCGDIPMWRNDNNRSHGIDDSNNPYKDPAVDHDKQEIQELKREILRMKVHMQAQELDALTEKIQRKENPAIKDAWDKYQTVLRLATK